MMTLNNQTIKLACSIILFVAASVPVEAGQPGEALSAPIVEARGALEEKGLSFEASLVADLSKNISGGVSPAGTFRHLFDFNVTLDMETLAGIDDATFFADFQTKEGQDGSVETGDLQAYSNIDGRDFTSLYEIWFQQVFSDGALRLKLGKIDANTEFAYVDFGGEFIHSSPGFSPTLFVLPTYPDPAFGVVGTIGENEGFYLKAGLFDGALQEGIPTGARGPKTLFGDPADLFLIGEVGSRWGEDDDRLPGRLGLGLWHHTGSFDRFSGGTESGATGFFVVFDQLLHKENPAPEDEQGLGVFAQFGLSDDDLSAIGHHVGAGMQWTGPLPGRDRDVLGVMTSYAGLSDKPGAGFSGDAEWAVELFYKLGLSPHLSLKPDMQYIANPGGVGLDDAWVLTLRLEASF